MYSALRNRTIQWMLGGAVVLFMFVIAPFSAHAQNLPNGYNVGNSVYYRSMWNVDASNKPQWANGWNCAFPITGLPAGQTGTCSNVDGRQASCIFQDSIGTCRITKAGNPANTPAPVPTAKEVTAANTIGAEIPFQQMFTAGPSGPQWANGWSCSQSLTSHTAGKFTCTNSIDGREAACTSDGQFNSCRLTKAGDPTKLQTPAAPTFSAPTNTPDAKTANADSAQKGDSVSESCSLLSGHLDTCLHAIIFQLIKWVALMFLFLASTFLGIIGLLFNWTIYITVFQFGNLIGNNPGMLAAWGVLRDIGNIILLFGFIFMGVSTILSLPGNEFTAKRALPALIIFALLMNFSLFAAEAIIDTSNALGTSFYRQAGTGLCPTDKLLDAVDCATNYGVAGQVMKISGITTIFNLKDSESDQIQGNDINATIQIVGLTLFASILAMVLLAAVFMLLARAVFLAFLMAVSPIGFAGMAIPPLHGLAQQWWDQIIKQAFFAPVYLLLVLISVKFMDGTRQALSPSLGQNYSLAAAFSAGGVSNLSLFVLFGLMIGFLLAATQVAKSMSAVGAGAATKMAGAAVFGGMARISNGAIGGASRFARIQVQRSTGGSNNKMVRALGVGSSNLLRGGEKLNTDIRAFVPGLSSVAGGPAEHATFADMEHQMHDIQKKVQEDERQFDREVSARKLADELHHGVNLSPESERFLAGLSAEQIADNHSLMHNPEMLGKVVSTDQFEKLMGSDKVSATLKNELANGRFEDAATIAAQIAENRKAGKSELDGIDQGKIKGMSDKELGMLAKYKGDTFSAILSAHDDSGGTITLNSQNDFLEKSDALTPSQKSHVKTNTRRGITAELGKQVAAYRGGATVPAGSSYSAEVDRLHKYARALTPKEKNKLDKDVLKDRDFAEVLSSDDLREFMREAKFTDQADRKLIGDLVRAAGNPDIDNYFKSDARAAAYWS